MNWTDVTRKPEPKLLRQFAGLWLLVFGGLAIWRAWSSSVDAWVIAIGMAAATIGGLGLAWPASVRYVYTGWMIAAFPIGWTVSQVVLAVVFFMVMTPIAFVMRLAGHDALARRRQPAASYWTTKPGPVGSTDYLRQY
jgi:hypothetical protein